MKLLNSAKFITRNKRKILPIFLSMAVSVFLIYFFSLFGETTKQTIENASVNLTKKVVLVDSEEALIPEQIVNGVKKEAIPARFNLRGSAYERGGIGATTIMTFNIYQKDVNRLLELTDTKLKRGTLPSDNKNELLIPIEYAKQNNLTIGDYIGTEISDEYALEGKYRISGLTEGKTPYLIACQLGEKESQEVMKQSFILPAQQNQLLSELEKMNNPLITVKDSRFYKEEYETSLNSLSSLVVLLSLIIILVNSVTLRGLYLIQLQNRREELLILNYIGYSRKTLQYKMFKEQLFLCMTGYGIGVLAVTLLIFLYNNLVLYANGKAIELVSAKGLMYSVCLPIIVSLICTLSTRKKLWVTP